MKREKWKKWKNRITSLLMCTAVLATSLQLPAVTAKAEETALPADLTPEEAFVLKDGNFELGDEYWTQFAMIWEGYTTDATFTPEAGGMKVEINDVGANGEYAGLWTVALNQDARLYEGRTYKLSFDLSSTIRRSFSYGMELQEDSEQKIFEELTGIEAGQTQTFTYEFDCKKDYDAKFYINLGAPSKGTALDPHTIQISNVRMEVDGAREHWVLVNDSDFTETDSYTLSSGAVTNGYVGLDAGGSITYPGLKVTAGETYELTFAARTDSAAEITASLGSETIVLNEQMAQYTNVYSYTYTASETKTADLKLQTSGGVYLDNIGFWNPAVKNALGLGKTQSGLDVGGISVSAQDESYPLGTDVVLNVTAEDFGAWLAAGPRVLINSKEIASELYTISDNQVVVLADAFAEKGKYSVAVAAPGYIKASTYVNVIDADGNLIDNGSFEEGFVSWTPYFNEKYSGTAEITADFMAKINITFFLNWYDEAGNDNGPVQWSTQLTHTDVSVKAGEKYTIRFSASSTVERPIILEVGARKYAFLLTPELQEFTAEYDNTYGGNEKIKFNFLLGPIAADAAENTTGVGITETSGHTMYFADFSMLDSENAGSGAVKKPGIIGIENGGEYSVPVTAKINYRKAYTVTLTKDGSAVAYTDGDMIRDDGVYVLTVADAGDPSIAAEKTFTIKKNIDYTKEYFIILSKATEKVIEASGFNDGGFIVQNTFAGRPGQFFTLEDVRQGYKVIRALSSGKVIQVAGGSSDNGAKLEQAEYTGDNSQLWKVVSVPQGYVKLENKASGKVIDISGAMKTEGLQLQQYDNSGSGDEGQSSADGQRFDLIRMTDIKQYMETEESPVQTEADWVENAFITPIADELNPAGPIAVEWYSAPGSVSSYDIYFDGKKCKTVSATEEETLKTEDKDIYSTEVKAHTMKIVANYAGGKTVETKEINFYITKKGVGWATLHRTEDMNLSWYYRWATDPALGTDENLTFVPMIWGNYGDEWLADPENEKYGTVLAFNEPDWSDQSNVPVTKELAQAWVNRYNKKYGTNNAAPKSLEESWQAFMDANLRIGSPATALAPPYCNGTITMNDVDGPDDWWTQFQKLMDSREDWDYDFTAIHSYNGGCDAKGFLQMIDETYELTGKPIWITEFGVAEWSEGLWKGNNEKTKQQVKEFLIEVIKGLEERDFVERYAWFPFDPDDDYGGASGIFDYATGELNELGKTYAMLGLPEGYEGAVYDVDISLGDDTDRTVPVTKVTIDKAKTTMYVGESMVLSASCTPANATDQTLTFSSSAPAVATVDKNTGKVTALKAGTVVITAAAGNGRQDTITLTITEKTTVKPTEPQTPTVTLSAIKVSTKTVLTKQKVTAKVTVAPAGTKVTWSSSNKKVATVNSKGVITGVKAGKATITATAGSVKKSVAIKVVKPTVKWNVSYKTCPLQLKKSTTALKAIGLKKGDKIKSYTSSNKKVVTVTKKGKITAKKTGKAKITVKTKYGAKATITIKVQKSPVKLTSLSVNKTKVSLKKGKTYQLVVTKKYITARDKVTYSSSNKKVATVTSKGKIKAKKKGSAYITIRCQKKTKKVKVTVK